MKRWNWPTTILYIKHKKANLKQGCSKLVGKKRKAPTGGWSGGLNCPIGTGEKKKKEKNVLACPSPERAELPDPGTTPGPGTAERARQPRLPAAASAGKPLPPQPGGVCAPRERGAPGSPAGYSFRRLSRRERSPVSPNRGGLALPWSPESRLPPPRGRARPPAPPLPLPRAAGTGHGAA